MQESLKQLVDTVLVKSGIAQKAEIKTISTALRETSFNLDHPNGDDAAALKNTNGYDLVAGEGFINEFVRADPWFAGWCGVMVNISDIAAMGGRPVAVTNTIWSQPGHELDQIYKGMSDASRTFDVPIVGGHTNLRCQETHLAVSIYGRANTLLSSFTAKPDDVLVAAIDLRGSFRQPFLNWNAATTAPAQRLREDIALLPSIAEQGLAHAAKDISQAGLLGTTVMMLESSNVGAHINIDDIAKPNDVSWSDWLCCFPSFGYLLATSESKLDELLESFKKRDISATCIGNINNDKQLTVQKGKQTECFWDLEKQPLTGFTSPNLNNNNLNEVTYARAQF